GDTGRFGFGLNAADRFHDCGHGGFFEAAFIDRYWKSLFHYDLTAQGDPPKDLRWYQRLPLVIPLRWYFALGFLAFSWLVLWPCLLWLLSFVGVEFSFLTIRHNYTLATVPVTAHYHNDDQGSGLVPPNSKGGVQTDLVQSMF